MLRDSSSPRRLPAERLSDFLEGRLAPAERESVLEHLANSPMDREALLLASSLGDQAADTAEIADPGASRPPSSGGGAKTRGAFVRWGAMGSVAAAAALLLMFNLPHNAEILSPTVALNDDRGAQSLARALRSDIGIPAWGDTRGSSADALSESRAFRIGVLVASAQRAAAMQDLPAMHAAEDPLARLVELSSGGSLQASLLRRDSTGAAILAPQLQRELRAGSGFPSWFDIGLWMESVRHVSLAGALERPAVRRDAVKALDDVLPGLLREGREGKDSGRLEDLRNRLAELRARLVAADWSSASFGALLTEAVRAGGG